MLHIINFCAVDLYILQYLPEDAILIVDGGDFIGSAAYIVHPRGPLQWLDPGVFGTLGVGAGFALGAKAVSYFVHHKDLKTLILEEV